jgi:hypothetical protein
MKSEPDKLHLIRGGMRTTSDVELDDAFQDVRRVLLDVAEELGPKPALAALESERVENAALILLVQRWQLDSDGEDIGSFVKMEQNLRERQTFLDSLVPEIEWIDCIEVDEPPPPPKSGLQLVWRNPAKVRSVAEMEAA